MTKKKYGRNTKLVHTGRDPDDYHGIVNPPVVHTSTILYPDLAAYEDKKNHYIYGRVSTPLSASFEEAMVELEGGFGAVSTPSGLLAITVAMMAFLKSGDHMLVVDSIYGPTREFCDNMLTRFGVEIEYYDPLIGAKISGLIKKNTAVIYMESPGSATFDVQDVPAIVAVAKKKDIITILDNSWGSGYVYNPLKFGVDLSVLAVTKYIGGHSDIMLGAVVARTEGVCKQLRDTYWDMGVCAGPDDLYLAMRGLRTLPIRMKQNEQNALKVIEYLQTRKEVQKIYYPALKSHPNHDIWKRDFTGANGLIGVLLQSRPKAAVHAFVDGLELFPVGNSWGGYESLLQPQYLKKKRVAVPWTEKGALLRLQVGLEDPEDLIADLDQAFKKFNAV